MANVIEPIVRINPTRFRRFVKCEADWYAYAVLKLDRLRPSASPHRDRGKAFHALLEYALRYFADHARPFAYEGEDGQRIARAVLVKLYEEEGTSLDDENSLQLLAAVRYHLQRFDLAQWEVMRLTDGAPLIEADLRSCIGDDVELQARVDAVLRHRPSGKVWAIDWKSTAFAIDTGAVPPYLEHDPQLAITREVLRANGVEPDFTALVHLRSRAPESPPLAYAGKKNERLSRNVAALTCDWTTYRDALIERGEDPGSDENQKVREGLAATTFVRWQIDASSPASLAATLAEVERAAQRMASIARGELRPVRRLMQVRTVGCERCDYETWCRAAMRNGDSPDLSLLGTLYEPRETSPLAGCGNPSPAQFDPNQAYVAFAAAHGRTLKPDQEFTP